MDKLLEIFLRRVVRRGDLEIETASGRKFTVGDGAPPRAGLRFVDAAAQRSFLLDPEMGLGEMFTEGRILVTRGEIYDALMIGADNVLNGTNSRWLAFLQSARTLARRWSQRNTHGRAARNVSHHYDIDSRLYRLFLDADMQYSCAYFEHPDASLDDAQRAKKRHIAAKLLVHPGHRVLDIGCGWGGMGLYLARCCGAEVTGVTLSSEQLAIAQGRARDAGPDARAEFHLRDYRDVTETFDRVVSVGMFEHVGIGYYDAYFRKIAERLTPDGVALIHTIGNPRRPRATSPWFDKYIFPGGYIPSMSEMLPAIERSGLIVSDVEILRLHYAETLKAWRGRFMARRDEARALYDERFCRMWEYYLAGSEASFRTGDCVVFQFQLCKNIATIPLTRDYIDDEENALRDVETGAPSLRMAGE